MRPAVEHGGAEGGRDSEPAAKNLTLLHFIFFVYLYNAQERQEDLDPSVWLFWPVNLQNICRRGRGARSAGWLAGWLAPHLVKWI